MQTVVGKERLRRTVMRWDAIYAIMAMIGRKNTIFGAARIGIVQGYLCVGVILVQTRNIVKGNLCVFVMIADRKATNKEDKQWQKRLQRSS